MKIKTMEDYIPQMKMIFPEIPEQDLLRMMKYGWKLFYRLNSIGGDVQIADGSNFWAYCGRMFKDSLKWAFTYIKKCILKLRILRNRLKIPWDGYYYFGLTDERYEEVKKLINSRGKPKTKFNYGDVALFKILDECLINNLTYTYIFRIPYIHELSCKMYKTNFITDKAELIMHKNPYKFKDILVSNFDYDYI